MSEISADPVDTAEAAYNDARERAAAAIRSTAAAQAEVNGARQARDVLIRDALAGGKPDSAAVAKADHDLEKAERQLSFHRDVRTAAEEAVQIAKDRHLSAIADRNILRFDAEQDAINAAMRARVPNQPDDDVLLSNPNPKLLENALSEANEAYTAAYHHWVGNPAYPMVTPRQRIIAEGQDWQTWMRWAVQVEAVRTPNWGNRMVLRQLRACIAARDHFKEYLSLGWDDLRRLGQEDYVGGVRPTLPMWRGIIAPCAFSPLRAV